MLEPRELVLELQQRVDLLILELDYFQLLRYLPKILLAIIIPIFDSVYHRVAVWLNDMGKCLFLVVSKILFYVFGNILSAPEVSVKH